jgi:hypothetical protein
VGKVYYADADLFQDLSFYGSLWSGFRAILAYSEVLQHELFNPAVDDPPDNNFQQVADPSPPPVLALPAGLTPAQDTAVTSLETLLAANIAHARGMSASADRAWGGGQRGQLLLVLPAARRCGGLRDEERVGPGEAARRLRGEVADITTSHKPNTGATLISVRRSTPLTPMAIAAPESFSPSATATTSSATMTEFCRI